MTIDGNGSETIPENTTLADIVITLLGVDIDELDAATAGADMSYGLGGADSIYFEINDDELTFVY